MRFGYAICKFDILEIVMKKHLRIIAVLLLAVIMMVGMTFASSAAGDDNEKVSFGNTEFLTEEELTPTRIVLLVVAAASLVVALCVKPVDRWKCASEFNEEPAVEPVDEPIEEPAVEPVDEPIEESAVELVDESIEEPAVEPVDEPIEEPAVEPVDESIEEPGVEPVDESIEEPVVEPVVEEPVVVETEQEIDPAADGQVIMVSYRSSFMSRLIQAETDIQDYYTVIKNTLLSYKGVKARTSWNYESFNVGRLQCAKINIKGRTLLLYLALNPADYNESKYHFTDASGKGKFDLVPMLLKVRSDRALKYAVELIEELMRVHGIEAGPAQNVDYHMPYETNEALAERDLVKVIVPEGVTVGENDSLVSFDVSDIIGASGSDEKPEQNEEASEAVVEEVISPEEQIIPEDVVLVAEESIAEEPVAEAEPIVEEELVAEEEPIVEEEPVVEAEPIVVEEPVVEAEPIVEVEPIVEEEPTIEEVVLPEEEIIPEEIVLVEETPVVDEPVVEEPVVEEELVIDEKAQIEIEDNLAHLREAIPDEEVVHVDAQQADELLSDSDAKAQIEIIAAPEAEKKLKGTKLCEVNIDTICENFSEGETVELAKLIDRGLVSKSAGKVKVLARGVMTKRLVVIADKYSIQAVKMITLAGGCAEQIGK